MSKEQTEAENYPQPAVIYTRLLIENAMRNKYEPAVHLGCNDRSVNERAHTPGETSEQVFKWHSAEDFERLAAANAELLGVLENISGRCPADAAIYAIGSVGDQARAAITKHQGTTK